jgi:hypothetical protein
MLLMLDGEVFQFLQCHEWSADLLSMSIRVLSAIYNIQQYMQPVLRMRSGEVLPFMQGHRRSTDLLRLPNRQIHRGEQVRYR